MGLGARMRRRLQKAGIATNEDFSGIMALHTEKNVEERLRRILDEAGPGCVVMTHPGDSLDPEQIADHQPGARTREARVLKAFLDDVD